MSFAVMGPFKDSCGNILQVAVANGHTINEIAQYGLEKILEKTGHNLKVIEVVNVRQTDSSSNLNLIYEYHFTTLQDQKKKEKNDEIL